MFAQCGSLINIYILTYTAHSDDCSAMDLSGYCVDGTNMLLHGSKFYFAWCSQMMKICREFAKDDSKKVGVRLHIFIIFILLFLYLSNHV